MAIANKNTKRSVGRFNENSRSFAHETSSGMVCEVSIIRLQKLKIEQKISEIIQDFLSFLKSSYKLTELFIFQDYMWLICDINRLINRCYLQNKEPQICGSFYLLKTIKNLTALITIDIAKRMR